MSDGGSLDAKQATALKVRHRRAAAETQLPPRHRSESDSVQEDEHNASASVEQVAEEDGTGTNLTSGTIKDEVVQSHEEELKVSSHLDNVMHILSSHPAPTVGYQWVNFKCDASNISMLVKNYEVVS